MTGRPRKLERAKVVAEAIALLDAEGFEGLTLRSLATRLNVRAPALYWHFPDRAALLVAMVDALEARIAIPPVPSDRAAMFEWICQRGASARAVLLAVRGSAKLVAAATARPDIGRDFDELLAGVRNMTRNEVTQVIASLNSFVLGWLQYEQEPAMQQFMRSIMDTDAAFRIGLRALARGLVCELDE
jgi:TetR/AcrR family transcriptional regulator, tetracycline repressor protein